MKRFLIWLLPRGPTIMAILALVIGNFIATKANALSITKYCNGTVATLIIAIDMDDFIAMTTATMANTVPGHAEMKGVNAAIPATPQPHEISVAFMIALSETPRDGPAWRANSFFLERPTRSIAGTHYLNSIDNRLQPEHMLIS